MFFRQYAKKYTALCASECMYFCIQSVLLENPGLDTLFVVLRPRTPAFLSPGQRAAKNSTPVGSAVSKSYSLFALTP